MTLNAHIFFWGGDGITVQTSAGSSEVRLSNKLTAGSFTNATINLNLSQSAISRHSQQQRVNLLIRENGASSNYEICARWNQSKYKCNEPGNIIFIKI